MIVNIKMTMLITWPYPRKSIKEHFECLLDTEMQKNWFSSTSKHKFWNSLDYYVFDYLIDGVVHLLNADEAIGVTLYNQEEADIISQYLKFYNTTFKGEMPDSYYINHPRWTEVIEGARKIVEMMEENNKKYNFQQDRETFYVAMEKDSLLDRFGFIYMDSVRDVVLEQMQNIITDTMTDHEMLNELIAVTVDKCLHQTLSMFKEYRDEMDLLVQSPLIQQYSLVKIADDLCNKLYSKDGWITQSSKYPSWQNGIKIPSKRPE